MAVVGRVEERRGLRTEDAAEARCRHLQVPAEVEARWADLRVELTQMTKRQAHDLAAPIQANVLASYDDDPGEFRSWDSALYDRLVHA